MPYNERHDERTEEERRLGRQAGAFAAHAKHGSAAMTAAAHHAANVTRFEKQVDPKGELTPDERAKRANAARRAHMATLSAKAAKARRLKRQAAA